MFVFTWLRVKNKQSWTTVRAVQVIRFSLHDELLQHLNQFVASVCVEFDKNSWITFKGPVYKI